MKLYKKTKLSALRMNLVMDARLTRCQKHLQLDRSDMIRMFINNALKYWEAEMSKNELKKQYEAHDHAYTNQDLEYMAEKQIKVQLAQTGSLPEASEQKPQKKLIVK